MPQPLDRTRRPALEDLSALVRNPVFDAFCQEVAETWQCAPVIEYSGCSMEPGWNVKFRKAGRSLCTVYPREGFFTVLVVVGQREKPAVEAILPDCSPELRDLYHATREGNGQRWLMADLEDQGDLYRDLFRLMDIRRHSR